MVRPIGKATTIAIKEVRIVPVTRGMMPKCLSANNGVHCVSNKNSLKGTLRKKTEDSEIRTQRIPIVVRILTAALRSSIPSIIFSFVRISEAGAAR